MRICRIRISNFANFSSLDVRTGDSIVVVGENKVGKSNLLRALQLVMDPGLSERDRQLGLEHFWDGLGTAKIGSTIEVAIELTDFTDDPRLMAHLNDCIVDAGPPMVARLTYRYQPKLNLGRDPESVADYEYIIFGGTNPDMAVGSSLRRMMPLDVQVALRDAEKDLSSWRNSPLRPLIEQLTASLDEDAINELQASVDQVQAEVVGHAQVTATAVRITDRLVAMAGETHSVSLTLGLTPTRVDTLLRGLRLLIDDGARGMPDASLGTANLIFMTLKSLELDRLVTDGERDHTFFVVEEPEAHLHPHIQRLIYRYLLDSTSDGDAAAPLTTILSTHSPHIVSVAPIRSVVLLRYDTEQQCTVAHSTAVAPLTHRDEADLQRYIDVSRGEIFFARGVILVEGDAERFLIPAFAEALGVSLDTMGVSVCSVGGTNFEPYVKLLGPRGLAIPHVILTDLDPNGTRSPRVRRRLVSVLGHVEDGIDYALLNADAIINRARNHGFFTNRGTLETELFVGGLAQEMQSVINEELNLGQASQDMIQGWVDDVTTLDEERLIGMIERIGKGRFAHALAPRVSLATCPEYVREGLEYVRNAVT